MKRLPIGFRYLFRGGKLAVKLREGPILAKEQLQSGLQANSWEWSFFPKPLLGCPWKLVTIVSKLGYNLLTGLTTYLYRGYNPVTKYHGHPSIKGPFCTGLAWGYFTAHRFVGLRVRIRGTIILAKQQLVTS